MAKKIKKFPYKLAFETEGFFEKPPTVIKNYHSLKTNHDFGDGLRPRAFRIKDLQHSQIFPLDLLESKDRGVKIKCLCLNKKNWWRSSRIINADGDEVWFVYDGYGVCLTAFGSFNFAAKDYIYIPRCTLYRIVPIYDCMMIGIESEKALSRPNMEFLSKNIPYNKDSVVRPEPFFSENNDAPDRLLNGDAEYDVYVKRMDEWTQLVYPFSQFLCTGFRGDLFPFVLHTSDINTVISPTTHTDPTAYITFASTDKSVCVSTFCPRWMQSLPYFHMNYWDEFFFYASAYEARGGTVGSGDATFHPQGVWHGPQIEAILKWKKPEHKKDAPWAEELAIMFESQKPLTVSPVLEQVEIQDYWKSWYNGWEKHLVD